LQTVLRPYVEKALLEDILSVLPITGLDVMETFGVPRGPEVGSLLQHAKKIWSPGMSRADLLGSLKATRVS
jgi:hypothetical protein